MDFCNWIQEGLLTTVLFWVGLHMRNGNDEICFHKTSSWAFDISFGIFVCIIHISKVVYIQFVSEKWAHLTDITNLETYLPDCRMCSRGELGGCAVPGCGRNGGFFLDMFRCLGEAFREATGMPGLRTAEYKLKEMVMDCLILLLRPHTVLLSM